MHLHPPVGPVPTHGIHRRKPGGGPRRPFHRGEVGGSSGRRSFSSFFFLSFIRLSSLSLSPRLLPLFLRSSFVFVVRVVAEEMSDFPAGAATFTDRAAATPRAARRSLLHQPQTADYGIPLSVGSGRRHKRHQHLRANTKDQDGGRAANYRRSPKHRPTLSPAMQTRGVA